MINARSSVKVTEGSYMPDYNNNGIAHNAINMNNSLTSTSESYEGNLTDLRLELNSVREPNFRVSRNTCQENSHIMVSENQIQNRNTSQQADYFATTTGRIDDDLNSVSSHAKQGQMFESSFDKPSVAASSNKRVHFRSNIEDVYDYSYGNSYDSLNASETDECSVPQNGHKSAEAFSGMQLETVSRNFDPKTFIEEYVTSDSSSGCRNNRRCCCRFSSGCSKPSNTQPDILLNNICLHCSNRIHDCLKCAQDARYDKEKCNDIQNLGCHCRRITHANNMNSRQGCRHYSGFEEHLQPTSNICMSSCNCHITPCGRCSEEREIHSYSTQCHRPSCSSGSSTYIGTSFGSSSRSSAFPYRRYSSGCESNYRSSSNQNSSFCLTNEDRFRKRSPPDNNCGVTITEIFDEDEDCGAPGELDIYREERNKNTFGNDFNLSSSTVFSEETKRKLEQGSFSEFESFNNISVFDIDRNNRSFKESKSNNTYFTDEGMTTFDTQEEQRPSRSYMHAAHCKVPQMELSKVRHCICTLPF